MDVLMILLIRFYQKTLSPDHGPLKRFFPYGYCRFHPTCSDYGIQAYRQYGFFLGFMLSAWRLCRCHPLSDGGYDPVPPSKNQTN